MKGFYLIVFVIVMLMYVVVINGIDIINYNNVNNSIIEMMDNV